MIPIKTILQSILGFRKIKKLIKQYAGYHLIFIGAPGIGDQCVACAHLHEYIKKVAYKKYAIVCNEKVGYVYREININSIIALSKSEIWNIRSSYLFNSFFGKKINKMIDNGSLCIVDVKYYQKKNNADGDAISIIRKYAFHLDNEILPEVHRISFNSKKRMDDLSPFIIINPYSGSMKIQSDVFEPVIQFFESRGYKVFCNVTGSQVPLQDTIELRCSVQDLYEMAEKAEMVFSIRSGILDYIIGNCKRIIAVYDSQEFRRLYSLLSWKSECVVLELMNNDNIQSDVREALLEELLYE